MALNFNAANRRVTVATSSSLNNFVSFSGLVWVKASALANDEYILNMVDSGGSPIFRLIDASTSGAIQLAVWRTTGFGYQQTTAGTGISADTWQSIGFRYDNTNSAQTAHQIYIGDLSTKLVESSYAAGAGNANSINTPQDGDLVIGNSDGAPATQFFPGDIAVVKLFDAFLSLDELIAQQWTTIPRSDMVLYYELGWSGTTAQVDYSGNDNSGTITGGTNADHVPLVSPFGASIVAPYIVSAAASGRIMSSLTNHGGLAGHGGIAGIGGGLAG